MSIAGGAAGEMIAGAIGRITAYQLVEVFDEELEAFTK